MTNKLEIEGGRCPTSSRCWTSKVHLGDVAHLTKQRRSAQ